MLLRQLNIDQDNRQELRVTLDSFTSSSRSALLKLRAVDKLFWSSFQVLLQALTLPIVMFLI